MPDRSKWDHLHRRRGDDLHQPFALDLCSGEECLCTETFTSDVSRARKIKKLMVGHHAPRRQTEGRHFHRRKLSRENPYHFALDFYNGDEWLTTELFITEVARNNWIGDLRGGRREWPQSSVAA